MGEHKLVSVVDDESVREALDALLRAAGLRVPSFASAEEFLPHARRPARHRGRGRLLSASPGAGA